jgi:phosphatidylserine/phosphatidylglycerophosphate/cardiolipin synthase-like enzyme
LTEIESERSRNGKALLAAARLVGTLVLVGAAPEILAEQLSSGPLAPIRSMGQPPLWKPYLAGELTWNRQAERTGGLGVLGVHKDLMNPMIGALSLSGEGYLGGAGGRWDGGGRLLLGSRLLFLSLGLDWNARDGDVDFVLAFTPYFRRGGLFGTGGHFRIEWIPGRGNSFNVGFQVPLEPHMGRTRPVARSASLPKAPAPAPPPASVLPSEAREPLAILRYEALWLLSHAQVFDDDDAETYGAALARFRQGLADAHAVFRNTDARHPQGHGYATEKRHYDEAFDRAFAAAAGEGGGREAAELARAVLLDEVLLPYDRLIGRHKRPDDLRGLAARGRLQLAGRLDRVTSIDAPGRKAVLAVFDQVLDTVEAVRRSKERHWGGDERKVWLPLQLALRAEDVDTQAEVDAVIERALGAPFTGGNAIFPTNSTRFLLELLRSIAAAEDYHVLWIHDYAGYSDGKPDPVAHRVTVEGYLAALTRRVRELDRTGRLPYFLIFQTQWFYEANRNRLFLSVLEDPLRHEVKLGPGFEEMEAPLRSAQEALRRAVAESTTLQRLAREHGEGYVRDLVKVHVSVTLPADLSFRSSGLVGLVPFVPDTVMLDHRKLFFYDVTEEDPRRGAALFTGTGVGATYMSPTWEDRGILVSGPSLVGLKDAARQLLLSQGYATDDIPAPLRPKPRPADYSGLVAELEAQGHRARGLNAHNEPGFAPKGTTFAQSLLYTLAPPDTIIVAPDSIWANPLWAGQLAEAALRGCHVYVIAPSLDNSPAPARPVMARTRELFARLFETSQILRDEIAAAGGHLRVGFYTRQAPAGDTLAKIREAADGLRRHPFLLDEFPLPPGTVRMLEEEAASLEAAGYQPTVLATGGREGRPKMHRKTQLFATRRALRALAEDPRVLESLRSQLDARAEATADPRSVLDDRTPLGSPNEILRLARDQPPDGARDALYYLTVGSKNQDPRSAFLDGETEYVVAGPSALWSYSDFMFLMAATTWVDSTEQIDALVPVTNEKDRHLGRLIQKLI